MQLATIPLKMPTIWGTNAGAGFRRQPPNASLIATVPGAASYSDGFVPLNFQPVGAGGVPPFGQDMNGVLFQSTGWLRWAQAGGPIRYDAQFQQGIGGYPAQARVGSVNTPFLLWQSTVDNNLTNPDAAGAGWQTPVFPDPTVANAVLYSGLTVTAAPGANSGGANLALKGNGNISPNKWIRVFNGNFAVVNNAYNAEIFTLSDAGDVSHVRNVSLVGALTVGGTASVAGELTVGNVGGGHGNDSVIRFRDASGVVDGFIFRDNTANVITISAGNAMNIGVDIDASGNLTATGNLVVDNNIHAASAQLSFGALGSGDPTRVVNLSDYAGHQALTDGWQVLPNGMIFQWGAFSWPTEFIGARIPYNFPFPHAALFCIGSGGASQASIGQPDQWVSVNADGDPATFNATAGTEGGGIPVALWWFAIGW